MSETSGFSVFWLGTNVPPMRFACSVTSGNRCRFSCFLGEQGADQWIWCFQNQVRCGKSWLKTRHTTRTQKLPLWDFGILKSSMLWGNPNITNQDSSIRIFISKMCLFFSYPVFCVCFFLVGPTVTVLVFTRVFCWFALFLLAEGTKKKKHAIHSWQPPQLTTLRKFRNLALRLSGDFPYFFR